MLRAQQRLMYVIPMTIVIIFLMSTKSVFKTLIVLLAVPFALIGAFWLMYLLGYNTSIAVWVGVIALAGVSAETGVVMLLCLDGAYSEAVAADRMNTRHDLVAAVYQGAVSRVRPKIMTASVILAGLLPIMWSRGTGADVMKRIAAPMVGGVTTSVVVVLLVYPAIYYIWKGWNLKPSDATQESPMEEAPIIDEATAAESPDRVFPIDKGVAAPEGPVPDSSAPDS